MTSTATTATLTATAAAMATAAMSVGATDIRITRTSDDEYLKIYLGISFSKFNSAVYRKLFNVPRGGGQIVTPNRGLRGGSKNYKERIDALREYLALSREAQQDANKHYKESNNSSTKKAHKENYIHLDKRATKLEAVANHEHGEDIARSVRFDENSPEQTATESSVLEGPESSSTTSTDPQIG